MTTNSNSPHILIFERDQQLAALLMSELQLAGYECHAARTAVEVFDAIARQPIRMVLVNLAQAAAGRREFWVALDAQRRGRGVQVLTFRCSNLAGYGPKEPDEGNVATADMEVDGMLGINELVDAVRVRIPGPVSTQAVFSQPPAPTPAPQQTYRPSPFTSTQPSMPVTPPAPPVSPQPQPAPPTFNTPPSQAQSAFSEKIRAVIYPNNARTFSQGPDSGPGWTYNGPEGGSNTNPSRQQPTHYRAQQPSSPDNGRGGATPTLSALANAHTNNHPEESGLARLSRLVQGNRSTPPQQRSQEEYYSAQERQRDYDDPMTITASHMRPSPIQDSPLDRGAELHLERPDVAPRSNFTNQQSQQAQHNQASNPQPRATQQQPQYQPQAQQQMQAQQPYQPVPVQQPQPYQPQYQPQPQPYQQVPVQFSPATQTEYIPSPQPIHYTVPTSPMPQRAQLISYTTMHGNAQAGQQTPQPQASMPQYATPAQPIQQPQPSEQFSPVQQSPTYSQQMSNSAQLPAVEAQPQFPAYNLPSEKVGSQNGNGNGNQAAQKFSSDASETGNTNPSLVAEAGTQSKNRQARSAASTENQEKSQPGARSQKQSAEKLQDGESGLSEQHRNLIEQIQTIVQGQMLDEAQMQVATDNTLLDIVQSLPPMPTPVPPQTPQAQVLNGRATRSLGSVLLEGHLVPQNRLEVAQGIQRMLRGVDLNYQLGEILLMFKLLTPDQLLAASLVSYGIINTQQISALGRVRQELHAIGLEYDLENLLILFRILSAEQLREVRTGW